MAQHDYSIANQGFPAFRSDLNDALAAVVSNNSGATEPSTMFAHQIWVDTAADPSILKIRNADNDAWITIGTIDQTADTFTLTSAVSATTLNTSGAVVFNDAGADVDFRVEGDTDANLLFVDASTDRIGIGTNTPAVPLDIDIGTDNNAIYCRSSDQFCNIALTDDVGSVKLGSDNGALFFETGGTTSFTSIIERMRINSSGALLVGTTAASGNGERVNITTNTNQTLRVINTNATSGNISIVSSLGANTDNTSSYHILTATNGATRFYVYGNGTSGNASDQRLKKNIETTRDGYVEDLCRLRVVKYNWKDQEENSPKELGWVAQEVEQVFPGLVQDGVPNENGETFKEVKTSVLPFMLLKAIQELKAELDAVKAELATLKG